MVPPQPTTLSQENHLNDCLKNCQAWEDKNSIKLLPHQKEAVKWCLTQEIFHNHGGIIADVMGLGKTWSISGLLFSRPYFPKTLVVVPASMVATWVDHFTNKMNFVPITWAKYRKKIGRRKGFSEHNDTFDMKNRKFEVVIATYGEMAMSNKNRGRPNFHNFQWGRVIFDEAHHVRNSSLTFLGALNLKAKYVWSLTGTPLNNRVKDISNIAAATKLPNFPEDKSNANVIAWMNKHSIRRTASNLLPDVSLQIITRTIAWGSESQQTASEQLAIGLDMIKYSRLERQALANYQRKRRRAAEAAAKKNQKRARAEAESNSDSNSSSDSESECEAEEDIKLIPPSMKKPKLNPEFENVNFIQHPLINILRGQQICASPETLSAQVRGQLKLKGTAEPAGKTQAIVKEIQGIPATEKIIVFSRFKLQIRDIQHQILAATGESAEIYDGTLRRHERDALIKSEPRILIMQIQTACEGLNLQPYSNILFAGTEWNPAMVDQAIGRVYRAGQTKPVTVWKFEMAGTNEHESADTMISRVQNDKRSLIKEVGL